LVKRGKPSMRGARAAQRGLDPYAFMIQRANKGRRCGKGKSQQRRKKSTAGGNAKERKKPYAAFEVKRTQGKE